MTSLTPPDEYSGPIVAGVGCASAATSDEIIGLIDACLAESRFAANQLLAIGTHRRKHASAVLREVAAHYGVPLRLLDDRDLDPLMSGVCEAVAAAAGTIAVAKRKTAYATCALARCRPGFTLAEFGQPVRPSAAIASSTEATSWAGP